MTVLIDHTAKAAEYDHMADIIAKDLIPWKQDAPRFASQLIRNGTVNLLMMIASIFDKPLLCTVCGKSCGDDPYTDEGGNLYCSQECALSANDVKFVR